MNHSILIETVEMYKHRYYIVYVMYTFYVPHRIGKCHISGKIYAVFEQINT